jgi:hypothetical protein
MQRRNLANYYAIIMPHAVLHLNFHPKFFSLQRV